MKERHIMYLNAGGDAMIYFDHIVGIFDMDTASMQPKTREYLERAQREGRLVTLTDDVPKSFIIAHDGGRDTVYLSLLSSKILLKRAQHPLDFITAYPLPKGL